MSKPIYFLPLALAAATPAIAQRAPVPDAAADPAASTIVVTATRIATPIDAVASAVTVLDKAAIDRAQDLGVTELLQRTPGVTVSRNGGYGTATSLRIRGAETDQTVVVIDGVKLNDPSGTGGGYNFGNLLVGDAARIEVLRGPQSILWGSQAIGGVVNIVTPLPTTPLGASFDVEGGSRQTASARAALGGKTGALTWRLGGQAFTTDGISAIAPRFGGVETDAYTNRSVQGRAELAVTDALSLDVRGYYSSAKIELDGFNVDSLDYSTNKELVAYVGAKLDLLDGRLRNRVGYGYTDIDRDNYNPTRARQKSFDAAGRNERLEYQGSFAIADGWTAVFGVENERSRFRSVAPPAALATPIPAAARGRARITSEYAKLSVEPVRGLTVSGGVRHDDHSDFGGATLAEGGAVWALPTGTVLRARYGEGFKAPTLYQLFSEYGNLALTPERAKSWEAGAEQHLLGDAVTIGATYFEKRARDQIGFASCTFGSTLPICFTPGTTTFRFGYYVNIARAYARGIEASAAVKLGGVNLDGNYSRITSEDRSPGATFGKWLARRPRETANLSASYTWRFGLQTGAALRWSGHSFDDAANRTRLDDYTLVDLRAELPIAGGVRLFGRVENVFDERYQVVSRYGTLGRSAYLGVRGRF